MPYLNSDPIFRGLHRCTRCLLPDSFPSIRFDESGVCNYCRVDATYEEKGEEAFTELLDQYRDKGKECNCIAPQATARGHTRTSHRNETVKEEPTRYEPPGFKQNTSRIVAEQHPTRTKRSQKTCQYQKRRQEQPPSVVRRGEGEGGRAGELETVAPHQKEPRKRAFTIPFITETPAIPHRNTAH